MNLPIPSSAGSVEVRLIGDPAAVAALIRLLMDTTDVDTVTAPRPARTPGHVRVYVTTSRRFPYSGGTR